MSLHQLVYISKATKIFDSNGLFKILEAAKNNNSHQDITGSLLYDGGRFIQILEGEKDTITSLYDKISKDPRHSNVKILYLEEASIRLFPTWSMSMLNLQVDKPKNLSELKEILGQIDEKKKLGSTPVVIKLFRAFQNAG
jgi:hypothetical protein|tara:strand:+ start:223 stop:642 length:420 start_codon:yes stop_codon:yes gene_type:complete